MRHFIYLVSEPAVLQEELRCCTRPFKTPEHSYAVSRPYFTPRRTPMQFEALSSRQRRFLSSNSRRRPLYLAKTLSVPLHWASFYSRGHLFDTHEQFEYNTRQRVSATSEDLPPLHQQYLACISKPVFHSHKHT